MQEKQYQLTPNQLLLTVRKAPILIRSLMFLFAFFSFLLPLTGMAFYMASGKGFHVAFLFALLFFGLIGFYLLRISLWNTYGQEVINFSETQLSYHADYGWFKDARKTIENEDHLVFSIRPMGYEDENKGGLVIETSTSKIQCSTKMPVDQLEELIARLKEGEVKR